MSRYARWARSEDGESTRIASTLLVGPVFLGLLPLLVACLGIAVAARTVASTAIVLSLATTLRVNLRRHEEGELAERFGEAYLAYKRETPFILSRRPRRE